MESQSNPAPAALGLLLFTSAALVWAPSASAQQFSLEATQPNLSPAIRSAFDTGHPALTGIGKLSFNSEAKQTTGGLQLRLPSRSGTTLGRPLCARNANDRSARASGCTKLTGTDPAVAAARIEFAPAAVPVTQANERLPAFYQEGTPFSTRVRLPLARLCRGRLQIGGFFQEFSTDRVLQGLAPGRAEPGAPLFRPNVSFGITLSLRRHLTLNRTLGGWFFGVRRL